MSCGTLAYLHCATCRATTLHDRNVCPECKTPFVAPVANVTQFFNNQAPAAAVRRIRRVAKRMRAQAIPGLGGDTTR